jgi:hypothetical protein
MQKRIINILTFRPVTRQRSRNEQLLSQLSYFAACWAKLVPVLSLKELLEVIVNKGGDLGSNAFDLCFGGSRFESGIGHRMSWGLLHFDVCLACGQSSWLQTRRPGFDGSRSVGIVRSRIQTMEFVFVVLFVFYFFTLKLESVHHLRNISEIVQDSSAWRHVTSRHVTSLS